MPKLSLKEWQELVYRSLPSDVGIEDFEVYRKEHALNVAACREAIRSWQTKDRPLEVLVIHGSGRHPEESCAKELSNSQLLLERGLEAITPDMSVNVTRIHLRDPEYNKIEPCNGCLSTASALCQFPCTCYPYSQEPAQLIYPHMLRADVMLFSTGVYQSAMSSRLKMLVDRCICLDGGYFVSPDKLEPKDATYRQKMIQLSTEYPVEYDPRLAGRVCAYFISSKDQKNKWKGEHNMKTSYIDLVAQSLYDGFDDYMCFHPDPFFVAFAADPDEEYSYDKRRLSDDTDLHRQSEKLVLSAIKLAQGFRNNGYPKIEIGRTKRT